MKPKEPEQDPTKVRRMLAKQARDKLIKEIENNNVQTAAKLNGKIHTFSMNNICSKLPHFMKTEF